MFSSGSISELTDASSQGDRGHHDPSPLILYIFVRSVNGKSKKAEVNKFFEK
jgi:hypothetical protein